MNDDDEERDSHFGWVRVELQDVTLEEARWFFDTLAAEAHELTIGSLVADVVQVRRDLTTDEERERERLRRDERRYWGD